MYISVTDLRKEGFANPPYDDAWLTERILLAQELFDYLTGLYFEERAAETIELNGTGHNMLWLPVPPVTSSSITSVTLNDVLLVEDTDYKVVMPTHPDGRMNPKLIHLGSKWTAGTLNVVIVGAFGFVDRELIDDVLTSVTPVLVKDCIKRIVQLYLPTLTTADSASARILQERLKDYSYRLEKVKATGHFNLPEIDRAIGIYKKLRIRAV